MKENKILKLIYVAWRERWTDSQFGINIKTVLPRGVSGDVYDLADCLLQQALVGTTANNLVLSHLQHSLSSHLVSYAAVLQSVTKYEQVDRVYCVISLLDFLNSIVDSITCRTKPEEALLPAAITGLNFWLMRVIASVVKAWDTKSTISAEHSHILDRACACAESIAKSEFLLGVLFVGYNEDNDQRTKILEQHAIIKTAVANGTVQLPTTTCEKHLNKLAYLDLNDLKLPVLDVAMIPPGMESISYCVQPLLAVEVLLNPCNDTAYYVNAMQMLQRLRKFSNARLFYEIIRAGFMSMSNLNETSGDTMWGAFTFFKVPQIIKQLNASSLPPSMQGTTQEFIPQVVEAFEMLLEDNLLLDFLYTKCSTNIIEDLLNDWTKQQLISEEHVKKFTQQRDNASLLAQKRDSANQSIINFIMRAEVPLSGILKTLSADYNKVQEALVGVLCQVLVGNSFDLILSVATVEGRLRTFVSRLIQCNENSKQVAGEIGKPSVIRSTLFDVSFLMLTFIVQTYGSEVVLAENGDSFFEKWVRECMVERNKPKNPKNILALCDDSIVDELLLSLSKPETQLKSSITWQDICMNLPGVLHHVLIAWEKESISSADVKNILENIKKRLFTYSVCATSFICSYMFCVKENELLKPLNMIQQFLTPPGGDEMSTQENVKERLGLSFQIIRKMQHDVHPTGNPKARSITLTQGLVSKTPLIEQFKEVWKSVQEHGWLPVRAAQTLESLLQAGGPGWLAKQLIEEILRCKYTRDMCKTMDLVFAILHLDIEETTVALIREVIPVMIYKRHGKDINEPQSLVLARLLVHCIISCLETRQLYSTPKKRTRSSDSDDLEGVNSSKVRKINADGTTTESNATAVANEIISDATLLLGGGNGAGSIAGNGGGNGNGNSNDNATATTAGGNGGNGNSNGNTSIEGNSNGNNTANNENTTASASTTADPVSDLAASGSNSNNGGNFNGGNDNSTNSKRDTNKIKLNEPFQSSIKFLFGVLYCFLKTNEISPRVVFAFQFITLLVEYGQDRVSPVLRLMPPNLIQKLLKVLMTAEISVGLITRLYDVRSTTGRQNAISDLILLRNIELRRHDSNHS